MLYATVKRYETDNTNFASWDFTPREKEEIFNQVLQITGGDQEIAEQAAAWCGIASNGETFEFREGEIKMQNKKKRNKQECNWKNYLDKDFGQTDGDEIYIEGYVYYAGDPDEEKPYRLVLFEECYIPASKRNNKDYISEMEDDCEQYIEDLTEEEAERTIESYLNDPDYVMI